MAPFSQRVLPMYWNCPHCDHAITPKTLQSVKLPDQGNRRAMQCPACHGEVVMNVNPAEYWQLFIPALGLLALWGASRNNTTASMVVAALVVGGGLVATIYIKKVVMREWRRFRKPDPKLD